jgi:hypothetical protein
MRQEGKQVGTCAQEVRGPTSLAADMKYNKVIIVALWLDPRQIRDRVAIISEQVDVCGKMSFE